ncbi:MAG: Nramp family divalent metal transporter [Fidelibacterota bacterium]|nr:MAG: Nramp family divalent metal transporter [Candidatus Neomarinimicrobiota bacterium]
MAVAATGIGAGDMVAATVAGAHYGVAILWVALLGALFKYTLNEGIARWQLATGTSILEGWIHRLGRWAGFYFGAYLVLWSFVVGGALMAACGLAGQALFGGLPVAGWGAIHALAALLLVWIGRYALFERLMKVFIAALFLVILWSAAMVRPELSTLVKGVVVPAIPEGSVPLLLGVMGGVGGSVTLLSYGYWIREKGWITAGHQNTTRLDLGAAYVLTGLFAIAVIIIAAGTDPQQIAGSQIIVEVAERLEAVVGSIGKWAFLAGFWAAVFSSMLGVWQGVPYIFSDFITSYRSRDSGKPAEAIHTNSVLYRGYLIYLAIVPMALLLVNNPVWVVVAYAVVGALFMPFLAATLLVMNNRRDWMGTLKSGRLINVLLAAALALFIYLAAAELVRLA